MATRTQQTTNYKMICLAVFILFLISVGRWGYLKVSSVYMDEKISSMQKDISEKKAYLLSFSDKPGFDKLQYVKKLEKENSMMPRSDHINAITLIFDDLLAVDGSDTFNISFSDFEISLDYIRLHGYVTNLRLLYQGSSTKLGLIERFEKLDFLDNISIKTYEKSPEGLGYEFTLTANVINNGK